MKLISAIVVALFALGMSACQSTDPGHGQPGHDHSSHAGHDHAAHGHGNDDHLDALEKALNE